SRIGAGQAIGPADAPSGKPSRSSGGAPASPEFRQYVCQPGVICSRSARRSALPAWTWSVSEISVAVIRGLRTAALSAAHVGAASTSSRTKRMRAMAPIYGRTAGTLHPPPMPSILPPSAATLPVTEALPALLLALEQRSNAVLVAPPGAGKTTLVPLALLDAPWRADGRILVLEPRRLAARAAASRMAELLEEPVGGTAGFRTRLDSAISARTRIEVVT